ncbi:MAG: helix-turn-helix transcriptional regulator [Nocardioidaceae bacterium]
MWVVTFSYDMTLDEDALTTLGEQLEPLDGSAARIPGHGIDITLWQDGVDPIKAATVARGQARDLVHREPQAVDVVSSQEHERRAEAPTLPQLVSSPDVAEMLGVSRQRIHQLASTDGFPDPLYRLRTGPVWDAREIEHFARNWDRRPGRRWPLPSRRAGDQAEH